MYRQTCAEFGLTKIIIDGVEILCVGVDESHRCPILQTNEVNLPILKEKADFIMNNISKGTLMAKSYKFNCFGYINDKIYNLQGCFIIPELNEYIFSFDYAIDSKNNTIF